MRARMLLSGLFITIAGCTETTGPNISEIPGYLISAVRVSPSIDTLFIPDSIRQTDRATFTAVAIGKNGAPLGEMRFVWSVSDPTVAVVDSVGVVTPLSTGTVEVTASADKVGKAILVILPLIEIVQ